MGQFEKSDFTSFICTGKRTLDITEKFTFQKIFRKCGTVDCHKGSVLSLTAVMDTLSEKFFSGTAFSEQHYIGRGLCKTAGFFNRGVHDITVMDNITESIFCPKSFIA